MSEHIDHAAEAREWIAAATKVPGAIGGAVLAVAEATLALVEQQRIRNLVEMAQSPLFHAYDGSNPALDTLMEKSGGVAPDIARALRIGDDHA
jgi:hypothetical protein